MHRKKSTNLNNLQFFENLDLNNETYFDYLNRLKKISTSIFEWVNLPSSMDARTIEENLFYNGQCVLLKDKNLGYINTNVSSNGKINIYHLPTSLQCYSVDYNTKRKNFMGMEGINITDDMQYNYGILVMNNYDRTPTLSSIQLFCYRLMNADRTIDININAQKFPIMLIGDKSQMLSLKNLYNQYSGNTPVIYGDKNNLSPEQIRAINTQAPYVTDKLSDYKKTIWNEALTYLGINNIIEDKKERLVSDEANGNNELINLNLQSFLTPRKEACSLFNKLFNLPDNKKIDVQVRSDLKNIIKNEMSVIKDLKPQNGGEEIG